MIKTFLCNNKNINFVDIKINNPNPPNLTIYHFLKSIGVSESYVIKLRKKMGYILLDGKPAKTTDYINNHKILSICVNPHNTTTNSVLPCVIPLDIVFEDDFLLIINKPSGLSTMPNRSHYTHNLTGAIKAYLGDDCPIHILNRLDKDTAGLILVGKNLFACNFTENIEKTYYAVCEGLLSKRQTVNKQIITLKNNLGFNEQKRVVGESSNTIETNFLPIKFLNGRTLLSVQIKGGKTHQIRIHSAYLGYPLAGDLLYGKQSESIDHTALICKELVFNHPLTNEKISLTVPYPQDFQKLLEKN